MYPVLSSDGQREWENIEENFYHEELTAQGYNNKRDKLFVRAGLKISLPSENTKDVPDFALPNSSSAKTEFLTKDQCQQVNYIFLPLNLLQRNVMFSLRRGSTQN